MTKNSKTYNGAGILSFIIVEETKNCYHPGILLVADLLDAALVISAEVMDEDSLDELTKWNHLRHIQLLSIAKLKHWHMVTKWVIMCLSCQEQQVSCVRFLVYDV